MNESYVTLQGWVGGDVDIRTVGETQCASFRVGSTPRYYRKGEWVDGETSWYTVNCWRGLAQNTRESIRRGDAVVVHGRVRVDVWKRDDGSSSTTWVVDATFVGHDLTRGTSRFTKTSRSVRDPRETEEVREMVHAYQPDGPQLDSAGNPVVPSAPSAPSGPETPAAQEGSTAA